MEGKNFHGSNGASWANQWEYSNPDASLEGEKNLRGMAKYKQKVGDGLGKTKAVASNGIKKVKEGTTGSLRWIKDKCHKTSQNR